MNTDVIVNGSSLIEVKVVTNVTTLNASVANVGFGVGNLFLDAVSGRLLIRLG